MDAQSVSLEMSALYKAWRTAESNPIGLQDFLVTAETRLPSETGYLRRWCPSLLSALSLS